MVGESIMKIYKASCKVGHRDKPKIYKFAPIFIKANSITEVQDKVRKIPAVGNYQGKKKAKDIELLSGYKDEVMNNWYKYSDEFLDVLNSDPHHAKGD